MKNVGHVVVIDNGGRCMHCGEEYVMNMPVPLDVFVAGMYAFCKIHRRCPAAELKNEMISTRRGKKKIWPNEHTKVMDAR